MVAGALQRHGPAERLRAETELALPIDGVVEAVHVRGVLGKPARPFMEPEVLDDLAPEVPVGAVAEMCALHGVKLDMDEVPLDLLARSVPFAHEAQLAELFVLNAVLERIAHAVKGRSIADRKYFLLGGGHTALHSLHYN